MASLKQEVLNVPNLLTIARVAIIPLVIVLLDRGTPSDCIWAALVYSAAAITDLIDGYLARRWNIVTVLGKFLDPLADKLLVMASLVWMVTMGRIAAWVVVLLLASATGQLAPSHGRVALLGRDPFRHPRVHAQVGFCPEPDAFPEERTGFEFVREVQALCRRLAEGQGIFVGVGATGDKSRQ